MNIGEGGFIHYVAGVDLPGIWCPGRIPVNHRRVGGLHPAFLYIYVRRS